MNRDQHLVAGAAPGALPTVTVVIPARNEQPHIAAAIGSVAAQDYPLELIEVIVVDGGSTDGTASAARAGMCSPAVGAVGRVSAPAPGFRSAMVIPNPAGTTPSNLNAGLAAATGEVLVRLDARSRLPSNYVQRCVEELATGRACVVGGRQVAVANGSGVEAVGIARALNNRFAMGGSAYRRAGAVSGPTDTVYLGAFRTDELIAVGGWATDMASNQDFELNRRLADKLDTPVWFCADLAVEYTGRARLAEIARQYHRFGRWKVRYWRSRDTGPNRRQQVLLAAPLAAISLGAAAFALSGPRLRAAMVFGAFAGAFGLESLGTTGPRGGPGERAVGVAAIGAVATGWLSGVVRQTLSRS